MMSLAFPLPPGLLSSLGRLHVRSLQLHARGHKENQRHVGQPLPAHRRSVCLVRVVSLPLQGKLVSVTLSEDDTL